MTVVFPAVHLPRVSVVIPTHNARRWVRRCLEALFRHTPRCYEVICVDNASVDGTREMLAGEVGNARLILNPSNVGFGAACNQGAAEAIAPLVLFLNSDVLVHPGWLPPLLAAVESDSRVGAASPRILNIDGTLQDAGPLVGQAGGTSTYGEGDAPGALAYRFPRVVDYANGACMLVRRPAFGEVGGFHPAYSPAYFEDVDFCFTLAGHGYASVYVPGSFVTHARGQSAERHAMNRVAEHHLRVFRRRFAAELASRPRWRSAPQARALLAARDARAHTRVLMISEDVPHGGGTAAEKATADLLEELRTLWPAARVTFVGLAQVETDRGVEALLAAGVEVVPLPRADLPRWLDARRRHYHTVIVGGLRLARFLDRELVRTQPCAPCAVFLSARPGSLTGDGPDWLRRPEVALSVVAEDVGGASPPPWAAAQVWLPPRAPAARDGAQPSRTAYRAALVRALSYLGIAPPPLDASADAYRSQLVTPSARAFAPPSL